MLCRVDLWVKNFELRSTLSKEWLDGEHVIFGEVLEGKDVVLAIESFGSVLQAFFYGYQCPLTPHSMSGPDICWGSPKQ